MRARIKYCRPCGYRDPAQKLAQKLSERFGLETELVAGNFGVFKVWLDDVLVFDKRQSGGLWGKLGFGPLPDEEELFGQVAARLEPR